MIIDCLSAVGHADVGNFGYHSFRAAASGVFHNTVLCEDDWHLNL
uniref:Uncharacterized protein n=1 Tax=Rhizophora mucronata TaxID=61149 RepID=A0A2P2P8Q6_RHIMU